MRAERVLSLSGPNVWSNSPVLEVWIPTDDELKIDARQRSAIHERLALEMSSLDQNLVGMSIVITGTVEGFTREEAETAVKARGGKVPSSVSKKTTAVVVGTDPGASKLSKAEELGVTVLDAAGFRHLLQVGVATLP